MKQSYFFRTVKVILLLLVIAATFMMFQCTNPEYSTMTTKITPNKDDAPPNMGSLLITPEYPNQSRYAFSDVIGYAVSIETVEGNLVHDRLFIPKGETISLKEGNYRLSGFFAVDSYLFVLFAVPHKNTKISQYLTWLYEEKYTNSEDITALFLSMPFTITPDGTTDIKVVTVDSEGYTSEDFGYTSFIVPPPPTPTPTPTPSFTPARLPETNVYGILVDAKTKMPLGVSSGEAVITFHGPDKDKLVTMGDKPLTDIRTTNGFFAFSVNPDFTPEQDNPLDITVVAHVEGYISTSQRYQIYQSGINKLELTIVNAAAPPAGVAVVEEQIGSINSTTNKVSETVKVQSGSNGEVATSTTVTLKEGTILKDKKGNPLTGNLTFRVGHFSPDTEEALQSFPGGFDVSAETLDGQIEDVTFVTAGFADIEITDENENQVETFEGNPLKIKTEISPGTINPETELIVQPGDIIPLWSYNRDTGNWKEEANGIVQEMDGKLFIEYEASHLSSWNLDWKKRPGYRHSFIFNGVRTGTAIKAVFRSGGYSRTRTIRYRGSTETFYNAPRKVHLQFYISGTLIYNNTNFIMSNGITTITTDPPKTVSVNLSVNLQDANGSPYPNTVNMMLYFMEYPMTPGSKWDPITGTFSYKQNQGPGRLVLNSAFPISEGSINQIKTYNLFYDFALNGQQLKGTLLFDLLMTSSYQGTFTLYNPMYPESGQHLMRHTFTLSNGVLSQNLTVRIDQSKNTRSRSRVSVPRFIIVDEE